MLAAEQLAAAVWAPFDVATQNVALARFDAAFRTGLHCVLQDWLFLGSLGLTLVTHACTSLGRFWNGAKTWLMVAPVATSAQDHFSTAVNSQLRADWWSK